VRIKGKAFTLIELMIVMAIIAILVGMVLPRFKGMRDQANISKSQGEIRALKTAVESYYIRYGSYPTALTQLWAATTYPRIIESAMYDPFGATTTTVYRYARSTNNAYYVIWSIGPDGTSDITGISTAGVVTPANRDDDVWTSNGSGT